MKLSEKTSPYYGVYLYIGKYYKCETTAFGKKVMLGSGADPLELAKLYDNFIKSNGLNKKLNFPEYPENLIQKTKLIQLTRSKFAIVDDDEFERLSQWKWGISDKNCNLYAIRTSYAKNAIRMHQEIMGSNPLKLDIDHIDGNGLNNQKSNLRFCTRAENTRNKKPRAGCSSIYKGVSWSKSDNAWVCRIIKDRKLRHQKRFKNEIEAAHQYDIWAIELHGEFARLNFPR